MSGLNNTLANAFLYNSLSLLCDNQKKHATRLPLTIVIAEVADHMVSIQPFISFSDFKNIGFYVTDV